jgi:hypothetical protein
MIKRCVAITFLFIVFMLVRTERATASNASCDAQVLEALQAVSKTKQIQDEDKLGAANDRLADLLISLASKSSLSEDPLKKSKNEGLMVAESSDHRLRLYSWDTLDGGTMHSFQTVAQYRSGANSIGKDFELSENGLSYCFSSVKTFHTKLGDTVYVLEGDGIGSSQCYSRVLAAYDLKNGRLQKVSFFTTPKKSFDLIEITIEAGGRSHDTDFVFADDNNTLKVPLIDRDMHNTGKFLVYKFDGSKFIFKP